MFIEGVFLSHSVREPAKDIVDGDPHAAYSRMRRCHNSIMAHRLAHWFYASRLYTERSCVLTQPHADLESGRKRISTRRSTAAAIRPSIATPCRARRLTRSRPSGSLPPAGHARASAFVVAGGLGNSFGGVGRALIRLVIVCRPGDGESCLS